MDGCCTRNSMQNCARFMVGNDLTKPEYDRFSLRVVKHFLGKRQFIRRHRTSIA
jgi:hypothetical protein